MRQDVRKATSAPFDSEATDSFATGRLANDPDIEAGTARVVKDNHCDEEVVTIFTGRRECPREGVDDVSFFVGVAMVNALKLGCPTNSSL